MQTLLNEFLWERDDRFHIKDCTHLKRFLIEMEKKFRSLSTRYAQIPDKAIQNSVNNKEILITKCPFLKRCKYNRNKQD